ncbi:acetyltransferase (GNAT) family protein [Flavobacterium sp. 1]|uniref:GNAT family N-acetyltransferase n=1 Tax=Flavobacterium sp. 1 TaxID=2035200 RepID=UPI000C246AA1|nr:GNAT family N-acetyltransferase [Flavobacterium sp. 1]PJJ08457.1 acetyltransferase (GNAT) family protein [Flavobacterium sp. 1]
MRENKKMDNLKIIEIKSDQIEQYKNFLNSGLINDEENFRITPNDDLNAPFPTKDKSDSFTLSAYVDNELAGVVSFGRYGSDREKLRHKGILFRMYVSEKFRGKGIAKMLIEELVERVKGISDIEQINLTVISNNENAKKLYEKQGFVTFGSEKNAIKWKNKYFNEDQMTLKLI